MSKGTQQQKQFKILLVGEICQDVYVYGDVSRISPEAPVPILKKVSKDCKAGMSGNVYQNIMKMIRFIDEKSNYQIMRYDIEKDIEALDFKCIDYNKRYDAVVISDYDKGYVNCNFINEFCEYFKDTQIFVDTKKSNLSSFKNSIIKLNELESRASINLDKTSDIITTLGSRGCQFNNIVYSTQPVEVYDVCGAGDVFLAALVTRWLETKKIDLALKTANNCAALSVTKLGCYTVSRKEYESLCV